MSIVETWPGRRLPQDPTADQLARYWTLSEGDQAEVLRCRGEWNRRWFAVQLCVLRHTSCFLEETRDFPTSIFNHVSLQLGMQPVLFAHPSQMPEATVYEQRRRICEYLEYTPFDEARERLEHWLARRVSEGEAAPKLARRAEAELHSWKVVLPAASTVERMVATAFSDGRQQLYARIAERLPSGMGDKLDALLTVDQKETRSDLFGPW